MMRWTNVSAAWVAVIRTEVEGIPGVKIKLVTG
jgi:hypothetical protein